MVVARRSPKNKEEMKKEKWEEEIRISALFDSKHSLRSWAMIHLYRWFGVEASSMVHLYMDTSAVSLTQIEICWVLFDFSLLTPPPPPPPPPLLLRLLFQWQRATEKQVALQYKRLLKNDAIIGILNMQKTPTLYHQVRLLLHTGSSYDRPPFP